MHERPSDAKLALSTSPAHVGSSLFPPAQTSPETPPTTPRRARVLRATSRTPTRSGGGDLWQHIPSSPQAPPSSPAAEKARFTALPTRARSLRSLEYACANARAGPTPRARGTGGQDGRSTGAAVGEAAGGQLHCVSAIGRVSRVEKGKENVGAGPQTEVEAAMVLLGFRAS
jgi:hypothetical protein